MKAKLFIRVDANSSIGTGHLMRCLALAQAWQAHGGYCAFIVAMLPAALFNRLKSEGMSVLWIGEEPGSDADAFATLQALDADIGNQYLVVDGYHFSGAYQQTIKHKGETLFDSLKLLVVDDNREQDYYFADYILNYNIHATVDLYPLSLRESYTKLLLGLEFCLLRRDFVEQRNQTVETKIPVIARKALVTLGGADPQNITPQVLQQISKIKDLEVQVRVIVGGANPHYNAICEAIATMNGQVEIIRDADDSQMAESMCWADMAVSAAGTTTWELSLLGTPCILIIIANNQKALAEKAMRSGLACGLYNALDQGICGLGADLDRLLYGQSIRARCSQKMQTMVKGDGCQKVIDKLLSCNLQLRPAQSDDCYQIWMWNNDPTVRKVSFQKDPISWDTHNRWYEARLADEHSWIFIAENELGEPVGLVRFQVVQTGAEISVVVALDKRNSGYGTTLVRAGIEACFYSVKDVNTIQAWVRSGNAASVAVFQRAGFSGKKHLTRKGSACVCLTIDRASMPKDV